MNEKERTGTSKFLSLVLRHEPEKIGLKLDPAGWADVETLLAACRQHGVAIELAALEEIVATNEKKRFAFSDDGRRIRASQGHSIEVSLGYTPQVPPPRLYHGTATRFLPSIQIDGLKKMDRHHVHLSAEKETAHKVGQRHGKPLVLIIRTEAMLAAGHTFFLSENGVWLTDHVPAEFIEFRSASRADIAAETVAISTDGHYLTASGVAVDIAAAVRKAVAGTRLHVPDDFSLPTPKDAGRQTKFEVSGETTIAAMRRLSANGSGSMACLNFASAKNPGGGFLRGSEAQEESLARSSALYPCLLAAPEYYERNRAGTTSLYLDLAIWSPEVPFFRDDYGALLEQPYLASVITAPAPNAGAIAVNEPGRSNEVEPTLRRRTAFVLNIAAAMRVQRLVLGAWGCGVFRNDPQLVALVFRELLGKDGEFENAFEEVVFAIYDRSKEQNVFHAFEKEFL
jgi:uncharacterized protein (TIGR02452 family)